MLDIDLCKLDTQAYTTQLQSLFLNASETRRLNDHFTILHRRPAQLVLLTPFTLRVQVLDNLLLIPETCTTITYNYQNPKHVIPWHLEPLGNIYLLLGTLREPTIPGSQGPQAQAKAPSPQKSRLGSRWLYF